MKQARMNEMKLLHIRVPATMAVVLSAESREKGESMSTIIRTALQSVFSEKLEKLREEVREEN